LKHLIEDKKFYKELSYSKENEPDYRDSDYPAHIIVSGTIFESIRVEDVNKRYSGLHVTLIYDAHGKPLIPYNDTIIKKNGN